MKFPFRIWLAATVPDASSNRTRMFTLFNKSMFCEPSVTINAERSLPGPSVAVNVLDGVVEAVETVNTELVPLKIMSEPPCVPSAKNNLSSKWYVPGIRPAVDVICNVFVSLGANVRLLKSCSLTTLSLLLNSCIWIEPVNGLTLSLLI